ncbi:amidase [Shewanella pealeana]|nr:amidase [Shewanella pealeana]
MNDNIDNKRRSLLKTGTALGAAALSGVSLIAQGADAGNRQKAKVASADLPLPEYDNLDVVAMAESLKKGELTPIELFDAAYARFESRSAINVVAVEHFEQAREHALTLSKAGNKERADSNAPLRGVPFALKDLHIKVKGTVTTNGSPLFKDSVATNNSTLTQRYMDAGLNIMAKLTSPEFGQTATTESALHGDTLNPWDLARTSGGSSGGSAATVAARILPAAHASDGGGSIRIPASNCGVFGLKPSRGRVPMGPGAIEGWMGLSVHNTVTRSVRDSALLLDLTQGKEAGSRITHQDQSLMAAIKKAPKGLKIAVMNNHPFGLPIHPDCIKAVNKTAKLLAALGHHVEEAQPILPIEGMFKGMGVATTSGLLYTIQEQEKLLGRKAREEEFSPIVWRHLQNAPNYTAQNVFSARSAFDDGAKAFDHFFSDYHLILSPVTAVPPPKIGALSLNQPYDDFVQDIMYASPITALFNMTGLPAMSVPLHWNDDGLPIGVQFAGPYGGEPLLLSLAAQLEQASPWADKLPGFIS